MALFRSRRPSLTGREHEFEVWPGEHHETARHEERSGFEQAALMAGRVIFGGYFLYNGINHLRNREMLSGYAKSKGVTAADVAVVGSGAMMILGGLSLITGVKPKLGASLVTAFLTGVTPTMHDYWNVEDQGQRMTEMINFTKNLALIGGAAFAAAAASHHHTAAA